MVEVTEKPVICIGQHTIGQLMAGEAVEIDAAVLIPASDLASPAEVEGTPPPESHVEGRLADLSLKVGDVVERVSEHDRFTFSDIGSLYDVQEVSPYFSSGLHLVKRGSGWTTMRDNGRFRVVSRSDAPPAPVSNMEAFKNLLAAAEQVLAGLNARIDAADKRAVPVFHGIVDLSDAVHEVRAALATTEGSDNG